MLTTRSAALGAVVLALTLGAAGCGGDDDAGGVSKARGSTATATVTVTASAAASETTSAVSPSSGTPSTSVSYSGQPLDLAQPPTTYAEAAVRIDALAEPQGDAMPDFTTPSGNIFCSTGGVTAGCEIAEGGVDDPSACPDNPMTSTVGRLEVRDGVAQAVCNTDTIRVPGAPILAYGSMDTGKTLQCLSERTGVTCIDRDEKVGFFLARGRYLLFNA